MIYTLSEDAVGSVYCPKCGMHVSKYAILAWERLSLEEQAAKCPRCYKKQVSFCPKCNQCVGWKTAQWWKSLTAAQQQTNCHNCKKSALESNLQTE